MKRIVKIALVVAAALALLAAVFFGALVMLEWKPPPEQDTAIEGRADRGGPAGELRILSWNIGYGGLDREADFFMDGGRGVHAHSRERVLANLEAMLQVIRSLDADVVLLQEVDLDSARTFSLDQVRWLTGRLPGYQWSFAMNFNTWVPVPLRRPLGRAQSGLLSLSRYPLLSARRLQLPILLPWPERMFHLKRCLHRLELAAPAGRRLVVYNLHLSVFDGSGEERRRQLEFLTAHLRQASTEGSPVVAGGDFNQAPRDLKTFNDAPEPSWFQRLPAGWPPEGFQMAFDLHTPSLRATDTPYRPSQTFVTVLDGFVTGPGVEVLEVKTIPLDFAHSDHHPVLLRVKLPQ